MCLYAVFRIVVPDSVVRRIVPYRIRLLAPRLRTSLQLLLQVHEPGGRFDATGCVAERLNAL